MAAAVRYFSRSGNTKTVAEGIAQGAGVAAVSVDAADAPITEKVDVLFLGGAVYAHNLDAHMKAYLPTLSKELVGKAVLFSTSMRSRHGLDVMRKALEAKGIPVETTVLYVKGKEAQASVDKAKAFGAKFAG